jgi:predicted O-methyltransferase YrrM
MNLGAHLHTVEAMQDKARDARSHLSAARVANWTLHQREAADFCASWNEPIDFLFLDADAIAYCGYWRLLRPHLSTRAVIVADNALTHPHLLAPFVDLLEADGGFHSYLEPLDNGLLLAYARAVNANKEG